VLVHPAAAVRGLGHHRVAGGVDLLERELTVCDDVLENKKPKASRQIDESFAGPGLPNNWTVSGDGPSRPQVRSTSDGGTQLTTQSDGSM
jgi:hypothetical protein